jgi:hypothetical protein
MNTEEQPLWSRLVHIGNALARIKHADGIMPGHCDYMNKADMALVAGNCVDELSEISTQLREKWESES